MKPNKLTPGANLIWESSRMIIPQHRVQSIKHLGQPERFIRPELTEEELEDMFKRLQAAKANTLEVTITLFGEYECRKITGIVTGLDPRIHLIKVETAGDWQLIEFSDVIGVDLDAEGY